MNNPARGENRIGRVVQENGASSGAARCSVMVQVQLLDPRGQPDGAPQAYRNPIGAKPDDLVVLRDDCILALATSARVLAHEETGRNARRA